MATTTKQIPDASNAPFAVPVPQVGRVVMDDSRSVVLAADHPAVPTVQPAKLVTATFNRPADTTTYTLGDLVANAAAAGSVVPMQWTAARVVGGMGLIRRARAKVGDSAAWAGITLRVHLFESVPTPVVGDNAAFFGNVSESGYLGWIDVVLDQNFQGSVCKGVAGSPQGDIMFKAADGVQTIFGLLEARNNVNLPGSAKPITVDLEIWQL